MIQKQLPGENWDVHLGSKCRSLGTPWWKRYQVDLWQDQQDLPSTSWEGNMVSNSWQSCPFPNGTQILPKSQRTWNMPQQLSSPGHNNKSQVLSCPNPKKNFAVSPQTTNYQWHEEMKNTRTHGKTHNIYIEMLSRHATWNIWHPAWSKLSNKIGSAANHGRMLEDASNQWFQPISVRKKGTRPGKLA